MPRALAGAALAVVLVAAPGRATTLVPTPDGGTAVDPTRAEHPPVVDGVLDDAVWKTAPLDLPEWLTYNPVSGQKLAQRTEVRVAYDAGALYFAFHCLDSEPATVRATANPDAARWSATPSRSRSTSATRSSTPRSGPSSWRAWAPSSWRGWAATP